MLNKRWILASKKKFNFLPFLPLLKPELWSNESWTTCTFLKTFQCNCNKLQAPCPTDNYNLSSQYILYITEYLILRTRIIYIGIYIISALRDSSMDWECNFLNHVWQRSDPLCDNIPPIRTCSLQLQQVVSAYIKPLPTRSPVTATYYTLHVLGVVDLRNYSKTRSSEKLTTNIFNFKCTQFSWA